MPLAGFHFGVFADQFPGTAVAMVRDRLALGLGAEARLALLGRRRRQLSAHARACVPRLLRRGATRRAAQWHVALQITLTSTTGIWTVSLCEVWREERMPDRAAQ